MGIIKDWREDCEGNHLRTKIVKFLSPQVWLRLHKYRKQRSDRGWSDKDTWGGGEYLMETSAGVLRYLETTFVDWPHYFEHNYENEGYTSLSEVAQDIENYLDFERMQYEDPIYGEYDINTRWAMQIQLYSQAQDAMTFVARNVGGLWW